jgi:hypothetical protein
MVQVGINQLRSIDEVDVPLSQLNDSSLVVQSCAAFLQKLETELVPTANPASITPLTRTIALSIRCRVLRSLNLFVSNRAMCALMLQSGIGPLLVPIGLSAISIDPLIESEHERSSLTLSELEQRTEILNYLTRIAAITKQEFDRDMEQNHLKLVLTSRRGTPHCGASHPSTFLCSFVRACSCVHANV